MTVGSQVLCTTSTLAVGVNLPARLVVLRGTRRWSSEAGEASGYKEYDRSTCLQMIGRAGRPQFDTLGTAVIMTQVAVSRQLNASLAPMQQQSKQVLPFLGALLALPWPATAAVAYDCVAAKAGQAGACSEGELAIER